MQQQIRFCSSPDGIRLAWSRAGNGPPLVKTAHWMGHLEYDAQSPVWRAYFQELAQHYTLIRYDQRGCGLSDRDIDTFDLETWVADLEAVVDAAGLNRFHLLAESQGGPAAITYADRHPERVDKLVIYGSYARGTNHRGLSPTGKAESAALHELIRVGWGSDVAAYRNLFANLFMPSASPENVHAFAELMKVATTPENAFRIAESFRNLDATKAAENVHAPTLIIHAKGDARVPIEEGRLLASLIPDARFVPLDTKNHILQEREPAFWQFFRELHAFLGVEADVPTVGTANLDWIDDLTARETEILECVAKGLTNKQIARELHLSPKTVRNYVSIVLSKSSADQRSDLIVKARQAGFGTSD